MPPPPPPPPQSSPVNPNVFLIIHPTYHQVSTELINLNAFLEEI